MFWFGWYFPLFANIPLQVNPGQFKSKWACISYHSSPASAWTWLIQWKQSELFFCPSPVSGLITQEQNLSLFLVFHGLNISPSSLYRCSNTRYFHRRFFYWQSWDCYTSKHLLPVLIIWYLICSEARVSFQPLYFSKEDLLLRSIEQHR